MLLSNVLNDQRHEVFAVGRKAILGKIFINGQQYGIVYGAACFKILVTTARILSLREGNAFSRLCKSVDGSGEGRLVVLTS